MAFFEPAQGMKGKRSGMEAFLKYHFLLFLCLSKEIMREQDKEMRGTQRQIVRDRAALEKQEKQMV